MFLTKDTTLIFSLRKLSRCFICVFIVLVSFFVTSLPAQALTYYIAPNGDDNNSGSLSQPWQTIAKANNTLLPGDIVLIRAGTYADRIRPVRNGTSNNNRIVYKVFGDGDVILTDFANTGNPSEGTIGLGERNYITVSGRADNDPIDIRRIRVIATEPVNSLGNLCGSEGSVVENIFFSCPNNSQFCDRGFSICINFWSGNLESKYNIFRNNHIKGISDPNGNNDTEDLFNIAQNAHHNLIENNIMELCTHSVVYADGPDIHSTVIRNNIIRNPQHTALSIHSAGVNLSAGARFLVENNHIEASGNTVNPHGGPGNGFQWGSDELIIRYNTITQGGAENTQHESVGGLVGATSTTFDTPYFATDGRVYNNTIVKNRGIAIGMFDFGFFSVDLGRNKFFNNFFYDSNSVHTDRLLISYWDIDFNTSDRYVRNVFGNPDGNNNQIIIANLIKGDASLATAIATYRNPQDPEFTIWQGFSNIYDENPGFSNYGQNDYSLPGDNKYIDAGAPLTTVASTDSGTGVTLVLADARFFHGEASEFPGWMGVHNDWIAVGPSLSSADKVQISSVQDSTSTLILSRPITRSAGDFVWLWKDSDGTEVLSGWAPDIGAHEFIKTIIPESLIYSSDFEDESSIHSDGFEN